MEIVSIPITKPADVNVIIAQSHFIKTVEDVHEALAETVPGIQFGVAFCEASGVRKIRTSGTSDAMIALAAQNAQAVGAGHALFIFLQNAFPVNVLNRLKQVSEIASIYCASANPVQVIVAKTEAGNGILGVIDGGTPLGAETNKEKQERKELLRKFGYKL